MEEENKSAMPEENNNTEPKEDKKQKMPIKKIIIWIIVGAVIAFVGIKAYEYIDNWLYDREYDKENKFDNPVVINCEMDEELENVVSCNVVAKDKNVAYTNLNISARHSKDIEYLEHTIPDDKPRSNTRTVSEYEYEIEDRFYVNGYNQVTKPEVLLNIKYKILDPEIIPDQEIKFGYISLMDSNNIYHHNRGNWEIKLSLLTVANSNEATKKYLCLNKDVNKDEILYKNMFTECTSDKELSSRAISEELLHSFGLKLADSYTDVTYYIKESKKEKDIINIEDIYWKLKPVTTKELNSQTGAKYVVSIGEDKVLYLNETKVFDTEEVKELYIRSYCCTGGNNLIVITENGNVYMTENDPTSESDPVTFKELNMGNIKEFHANYYEGSMGNTHVYAIDSEGKEHLID